MIKISHDIQHNFINYRIKSVTKSPNSNQMLLKLNKNCASLGRTLRKLWIHKIHFIQSYNKNQFQINWNNWDNTFNMKWSVYLPQVVMLTFQKTETLTTATALATYSRCLIHYIILHFDCCIHTYLSWEIELTLNIAPSGEEEIKELKPFTSAFVH